tara:strand:- start:192 stop:677 length:486 start_codon:yes stop_codon:yes gene_type:complete
MRNITDCAVVYRITNLDDGRTYVGSTTQSIKQRLESHKYDKTSVIYNFNFNNIKSEVLFDEKISNNEQLLMIEQEYIDLEFKKQGPKCVNRFRTYRSEEQKKIQKLILNREQYKKTKYQLEPVFCEYCNIFLCNKYKMKYHEMSKTHLENLKRNQHCININ